MLIKDFGCPVLAFTGRDGALYTAHQCSLLGWATFSDRYNSAIAKLKEFVDQIDGDSSTAGAIAHLYRADPFFRDNCDACLRLSGIDPDCLDSRGQILTGLLFDCSDGNPLLIELNQQAQPTVTGNNKPGTVHDLLASLWEVEGSFDKAVDIATSYPQSLVTNAIAARARHAQESAAKASGKISPADQWVQEQRSHVAQPMNLSEMRELLRSNKT